MPMDAPTLARTAVPFIAPSLDLRRLWRNLLERLGDLRTWMLHRAAEPHGAAGRAAAADPAGDAARRPYTDDELSAIVLRYQDMIYRLLVVRMKDSYAADDLFQEVFLRLVRAGKRFDSEEHLKAWLLRVAVNLCNDRHRSAWNRRTVLYDDRVKRGGDREDDAGEDFDDPDEPGAYDDADAPEDPLRSATFAAVQALKPKLREVVHLFYYEELSVREIAGILGIGESAVKTRLSRARESLRGQLGEICHG